MSREISGEVWGFPGPMLPAGKTAGRPWTNHRCRAWSANSPTRPGTSTGRPPLIRRSHTCISTAQPSPGTQGAPANHKNLRVEPPAHAIGRSRGGLTCKAHMVAGRRGQTAYETGSRARRQARPRLLRRDRPRRSERRSFSASSMKTRGRTCPSRKARRRSAACSAVIAVGVGAGRTELRCSVKASRRRSVGSPVAVDVGNDRLSQRRTPCRPVTIPP